MWGLVLVSGQVALGDDGTVVSDDPRDQAEQCFANIESALSLAGARVSDVVKLVCYLTDASYFGAYSDARAKCLVTIRLPVRPSWWRVCWIRRC